VPGSTGPEREVHPGTDVSGVLHALDPATGADRWTVDSGHPGGSDPSLVALDARRDTGAVAWTRDPGDEITEVSAGRAPDGTVLLGTNRAREWAHHPDGSPAWDSVRTSVVVDRGYRVSDAGPAGADRGHAGEGR
jgi:outer membrane protein assembly factor BamB